MKCAGATRAVLLAGALFLAACGAGAAPVTTAASAPFARGSVSRVPDGDWTRFDYNAQRSGVGPASTGINARDLGRLRRRTIAIHGTVDSSPIQLHAVSVGGRVRDVVIMTTTYGRTLAIDPRSGARLWEFAPRSIGSWEGSYQITTTTPIADPDRRHVYAATPDGWIRKLTVSNGRQVWASRVTFDASHEKLASALNISGSNVIAVTGGYVGDAPPYQGHVLLIDRRTGRLRRVWNSLCSNRHYLIHPPGSCPASDSAIWARAGAVVEPGSGRLLVATGNGPFNGVTNWGDSVLELSSDASRLLHNWTPRDQRSLDENDTDIGSSAPALLPGHLAVQGAKDGLLHLLDLSRLNGTRGGPSARLGGELQDIPTPGAGELLTAPVVWSHAGRTYVFAADDSGTSAYVLGANRRLRVVWRNGSGGTSPVLAGGLLYVYDQNGGALNVLNPTNGGVLASLPARGGHWNSPIVIGGRIILPVGDANDHIAGHGTVYVYYLPGR